MRWFPVILLGYVFVAVQFSLYGVMRMYEKTPNLVLLLVIFLGLHAPMEPALLAGFLLGLMHDIIAAHGVGTYTLAYTCIAFMAVQLRGVMYSDHLVTHVMITLLLGTSLAVYLVLREWLRNLYFEPQDSVSFGPQMLSVLLTSLLAIPVIGGLRRIRRSFAFENKN